MFSSYRREILLFFFYFILWPIFSYFDRAFFHCAPLSFCMSSDFQQHLMNYVHNNVAALHSYFWWSDKAVDYKFITSEWALCKTLWTKRNTSMTYLSSKSLYFNFTKKKTILSFCAWEEIQCKQCKKWVRENRHNRTLLLPGKLQNNSLERTYNWHINSSLTVFELSTILHRTCEYLKWAMNLLKLYTSNIERYQSRMKYVRRWFIYLLKWEPSITN